MDETGNIISLYKNFKEESEKEAFLQFHFDTINKLKEKNKQLEDEVIKLQNLLASSKTQTLVISTEESLIDHQIELIEQRAKDKELSLEDIKKLDLLIKNKNVLNKSFSDALEVKYKNLSKDKLIQIAASNESQ